MRISDWSSDVCSSDLLRRFERVYAVPVMCPAAHLEPGVVEVSSAPIAGIFDIGRYPTGVDDVAEAFAAALSSSGFSSEARPDVMPFTWAKLLMNLANALEAGLGKIDKPPGLPPPRPPRGPP